jgi:hypothetical protein
MTKQIASINAPKPVPQSAGGADDFSDEVPF